jgi:glycosyltransferase involved in cell wall biosynthesis
MKKNNEQFKNLRERQLCNVSVGKAVELDTRECTNMPRIWPNQVFTNGKTGLLYRYADIDDLVAKIEELLSNPARRKKMGEEARRTIFEDFTIEKMCQGFIDGINYAMSHPQGETAHQESDDKG